MSKANEIVRSLLEAESDPVASEFDDLVKSVGNDREQDEMLGKVTYEKALTCDVFYHRTKRYAGRRGKNGGPLQVRRNGRTQTWKRRPGEFRIPCKYGLYEYYNITDKNADEWSTIPDFEENEKELERQRQERERRERLRQMTAIQRGPVQPSPDTPLPPPESPDQLKLFHEHRARLRELGVH